MFFLFLQVENKPLSGIQTCRFLNLLFLQAENIDSGVIIFGQSWNPSCKFQKSAILQAQNIFFQLKIWFSGLQFFNFSFFAGLRQKFHRPAGNTPLQSGGWAGWKPYRNHRIKLYRTEGVGYQQHLHGTKCPCIVKLYGSVPDMLSVWQKKASDGKHSFPPPLVGWA